jgi:STAS domain
LPAPSPPSTPLVVSGSIRPAEIPLLCDRLGDLAAAAPGELVVCDVSRLVADLKAVDALARLRLTAGRLGVGITLTGASPALDELIAICGLTCLLRPRDPGSTTAEAPTATPP